MAPRSIDAISISSSSACAPGDVVNRLRKTPINVLGVSAPHNQGRHSPSAGPVRNPALSNVPPSAVPIIRRKSKLLTLYPFHQAVDNLLSCQALSDVDRATYSLPTPVLAPARFDGQALARIAVDNVHLRFSTVRSRRDRNQLTRSNQ